MRLIDKDALKVKAEHIIGIDGSSEAWRILAEIDNAEEIDAVEVVRCRECKWCECFYHGSSNLSYRCKKLYLTAEAVDNGNGFCSYGERRTE